MMYGSLIRDRDITTFPFDGPYDPALLHRGGPDHVLRVHDRHVARWAAGLAPDPGPWLMGRLASDKTMRIAFGHISKHGGTTPGPNGLSLHDLDDNVAWQLCRGLAREIRDGVFAPGPLRKLTLSKGPGRGDRELRIPNLEDRVVGRALVEIIQPMFDPAFQPFSFGWRPGLDRRHALASVIAYARHTGCWHWVIDDVQDAFGNIPRGRMVAACRRLLPTDVTDFIALLSAAGQRGQRGMAQGAPASPILANIHFDAHLDDPWYQRFPGEPLIRSADDLLIPAPGHDAAEQRHDVLRQIAQSNSGTTLKGGDGSGVHDLIAGDAVDWMGWRIQVIDGRLTVKIGARAWWHVEDQLMLCHHKPDPASRAVATVLGWLDQLGPVYRHERIDILCHRVLAIAAGAGFHQLIDADTIQARLSVAHARYRKLAKAQRGLLDHRIWLVDQWRSRRPWPPSSST